MSVIKVSCIDQVMTLTNTPVIASGGVNENYIEFSFCSQWDGFAKVCAFYQQPGAYYHSLLDSTDRCIIPAEVCAESGPMYFGVVGVKDDVTRTSEVVKYKLAEGVMTEITDPAEDVYQQILAELAAVRELIADIKMPEDIVTQEQLRAHTSDKDNPHGVTAEQVGAAPAGHTHTPASIGAAAASHTHKSSEISGYTGGRALISTSAGVGVASDVTTTELRYLSGAKSNIQTQLDAKSASDHTHTPASIGAAALNSDGKVEAEQSSATVLNLSTATTVTLGTEHCGKCVVVKTGAKLTIPTDKNNTIFPIGSEIEVFMNSSSSAGVITLECEDTELTGFATSNGRLTSIQSEGAFAVISLKKTTTATWIAKGDIA